MQDFYNPTDYIFVLEEVCDIKTLRDCQIAGKKCLDALQMAMFVKYLNRHINNATQDDKTSVSVYYSTKTFENQSIGRMYPIISIDGVKPEMHKERRTMTFSYLMPKILRSTLCYENYYDIDFKCSHHVILSQLLQKYNIQCSYLINYVNNRDTIIKDMCEWHDVEKDKIKDLFIQILYGKNYKTWKKENDLICNDNDFVKNFEKDIKKSVNSLLKINAFDRYIRYANSNNDTNNPFSAIFHVLATIENHCLVQLYHHYKKLGYQIGSFEFDGLKVFRKDKHAFPKEHLVSGQAYIKKKTGYDITLVEKIMEPYPDLILNNTYIVKGDVEASRIILNKMKNKIMYSESSKTIYYKTKNTWELLKSHRCLKNVISEYNMISSKSTKNYELTQSTNFINNVAISLVDEICKYPSHCVNNFEQLIKESTRGKLCYKNGVYDFKTKEFLLWSDERTNKVYTTIIIDREFDKNCSPEKLQYIYNTFEEQFGSKSFPEVLKITARAIAGHVEDKRWITLFGNRSSGKGVWEHMLRSTFTNYISSTSSESFICRPNGSDIAKEKGWTVPIRHSRLVITNEISPNVVINGAMIKLFAGGGDPITGRELYGQPITFVPQCTLMICCNDIAKVNPIDTNNNRIVIDMPYSYVSQNEIDDANEIQRMNLKLGNSEIKNILTDDIEYLKAFELILFDHYENKTPSVPYLIEIGKGFLDNPVDVKTKILERFVIEISNKKLFISNDDLSVILEDIRDKLKIKDTIQKMKKILKDNGAEDKKIGSVRGLACIKIREENIITP